MSKIVLTLISKSFTKFMTFSSRLNILMIMYTSTGTNNSTINSCIGTKAMTCLNGLARLSCRSLFTVLLQVSATVRLTTIMLRTLNFFTRSLEAIPSWCDLYWKQTSSRTRNRMNGTSYGQVAVVNLICMKVWTNTKRLITFLKVLSWQGKTN